MVSFNLWIPAVTKPKETFASAKKKVDRDDAIKQVAVAGIIGGLINGAIGGSKIAETLGILAMVSKNEAAIFGWAGAAIGAVVGAIAMPILMVACLFIGCFIIDLIVTKAFKGKGDSKQLFYLMALYTAPLSLLSTVLSLIPIIGLFTFLIGLYQIYLLYLAVKAVYTFKQRRSRQH